VTGGGAGVEDGAGGVEEFDDVPAVFEHGAEAAGVGREGRGGVLISGWGGFAGIHGGLLTIVYF
jgi:hypothetical protein